MSVGSPSDLARIRDAASCRDWLNGLPADGGERLAAIGTLLARLGRPGIEADPLFEMLEQLRCAQLRAIERWLAPLAGRALPFGDDDWQRIGAAIASLRGSRNLFKRVYSQMMRVDGDDTRSIIPGATDTLRVVMPLARALDAQVHIVTLLLRHRCVVHGADWDELCLLTRHIRRTTFLDETLLDEVPLVKPTTARALFVYPLLVALAEPSARSAAEAQIAERLAARMAARVGFRIDHGLPLENPQGPALSLTAEHGVRLDTHRISEALARRREQWLTAGDAAVRRRLPLGDEALMALLDDLHKRWVEPRPGLAPQPAPVRQMRLRFGLPRLHSADMRVKVDARAAGNSGGSQYIYGRWEQNTIIRLSLGTDSDRRDQAAILMAEGETVQWLEKRADACVVERPLHSPRTGLGAVLALSAPATAASSPDSAQPAASPSASTSPAASRSASPAASRSASPAASRSASPAASRSASPAASRSASPAASQSASPAASQSASPAAPSSWPSAARSSARTSAAASAAVRGTNAKPAGVPDLMMLGVIESIEQVAAADYLRLSGVRLRVRCWPGTPVPVGIRIGEAMFFEDAWLLPGDGAIGEAPSLILAPGRAQVGARGLLREPDRDVSVRFLALAGRGPGYERLRLQIEGTRG